MSDVFHVCFDVTTTWGIKLPARTAEDAVGFAKTLYERHGTSPFESTDVVDAEWDAERTKVAQPGNNDGPIDVLKALLNTSELNSDDLEPSTRRIIKEANAELRIAGAS